MCDVWCEAVGPVVEPDLIVGRVRIRDCTPALERRARVTRCRSYRQRLPVQSLAEDEGGDGAICRFGLVGPFDVAAEVGRFAL